MDVLFLFYGCPFSFFMDVLFLFNVNCPWSGQYDEVTRHLDDCAFIPGSAGVTMQNAMLKAAHQRAEQKYEKLKQETARQIRRVQQESDHRFKVMEQLSNERNHDLV